MVKRKRHIAKTITWRITATLTTGVVAWIITGDPTMGLTVGGVEFIIKLPIYYYHERIWYKSKYGLKNNKQNKI